MAVALPSSEMKFLTRAQFRLLAGTLAGLLIIAIGVAGYFYVASASDRAEAAFAEGMRLAAAGKHEEAIVAFTRAISISEAHARSYLERGNERALVKQFEQALDDLDHASALDSNLAEAHTSRGAIFRDRGDLEHALAEFNKSIQTRPTMDAYYQRAQIEAVQNEHAKAVADYDLAIAQNRAAPFIYSARAASRRALGDVEGATQDMETAETLLHRLRR